MAKSTTPRVLPTPEEFVILSIETNKALNVADGKPHFKGMHVVYSGFNEAFKQLYPSLDSREVTTKMMLAGTIKIFPVKRGVMLVLPSDVTAKQKAVKSNALLDALNLTPTA